MIFWQRNIICFALFLMVCFLMLLRENIFLEINAILNQDEYNKAYFYFFENVFQKMSHHQLILWKWVLTVGFIVAVSGITLVVIYLWFRDVNFLKTSLWVYGFLFIVLVILFSIFKLTNTFEQNYFILRKLIGVMHSPLLLFIFFTLFYYLEKKQLKK